jgi:hypothetical protein
LQRVGAAVFHLALVNLAFSISDDVDAFLTEGIIERRTERSKTDNSSAIDPSVGVKGKRINKIDGFPSADNGTGGLIIDSVGREDVTSNGAVVGGGDKGISSFGRDVAGKGESFECSPAVRALLVVGKAPIFISQMASIKSFHSDAVQMERGNGIRHIGQSRKIGEGDEERVVLGIGELVELTVEVVGVQSSVGCIADENLGASGLNVGDKVNGSIVGAVSLLVDTDLPDQVVSSVIINTTVEELTFDHNRSKSGGGKLLIVRSDGADGGEAIGKGGFTEILAVDKRAFGVGKGVGILEEIANDMDLNDASNVILSGKRSRRSDTDDLSVRDADGRLFKVGMREVARNAVIVVKAKTVESDVGVSLDGTSGRSKAGDTSKGERNGGTVGEIARAQSTRAILFVASVIEVAEIKTQINTLDKM